MLIVMISKSIQLLIHSSYFQLIIFFSSVCSYKMHLLSKHKFYASADKLFHEFFSITNLENDEKILPDSPLSTHVAAAIAAAKANEAAGGIRQLTSGGHDGLYINSN
jgi:hypothetical protein